MTMLDPSALKVPAWMSLTQAGTILEPLIRNGDHLQVLLDAIERDEIEMRLQTANGGVILLPADAILHLKPRDIDWANSRVFTNRLLFEPGAHAAEESLAVKISRDDFIARFKHLLIPGGAQNSAVGAGDAGPDNGNKGGRPYKADWSALKEALKSEILAVGFPNKDGESGWRNISDVARWMGARLADDEEVSSETLRKQAGRMISEIEKELGRN